MTRGIRIAASCLMWLALAAPLWAGQEEKPKTDPLPAAGPPAAASDPWPAEPRPTQAGQRVRLSVDFMAGYGQDMANATLGFERQGRVGYAIITAEGKISRRLSFLISLNPVNETSPVPGCGAPGYFYPNDPKMLYGADTTVPCNPQYGDRRVDEYRGIALDVVPQQGALREAYVDISLTSRLQLRAGRARLPIGFRWEDAGSFTAKDAPRIQRINAQNSFGFVLSYTSAGTTGSRPRYSGQLATYLGEGNRWWDYNYFYFQDSSLDSNTALTFLASGQVSPISMIEVRASYQRGKTGSKVERLPSYWASKRNDDATVVGLALYPLPRVRLIAETARYTWGPTVTSAQMLGVDTHAIEKRGSYVTLEAWQPITKNLTVGGSVSRERVDRADSLIRRLADEGLYQVVPGKKDGLTAARLYANFGPRLRIGVYRTFDSNPFPWLSGITAVSGPNAYQKRNTNKWGVVARIRVS